MKRKPIKKKKSEKLFRKTAQNVKKRNFRVPPMRGVSQSRSSVIYRDML